MKIKQKVIISCSVGSRLGLGHWYRCLALGEELKKRGIKDLLFLTDPLPVMLEGELKARGIRYDHSRDWSNIININTSFSLSRSDLLILDIVNAEKDYVEKLSQIVTVITIGGSGEGRNYADVRIDGMIVRPGYADGFCGRKLFIGPEYIILRNCFFPDPRPVLQNSIKRVLIALGGDSTARGIYLACLLKKIITQIKIDIIIGPIAEKNMFIPEDITVHHAVGDPRMIMESCDVAITGGGITSYELMRLGIPMIFYPQGLIQDAAAEAFERAGVGLRIPLENQGSDGMLKDKLEEAVLKISSLEVRAKFSANGMKIIDGKGLKRVADIIENVH